MHTYLMMGVEVNIDSSKENEFGEEYESEDGIEKPEKVGAIQTSMPTCSVNENIVVAENSEFNAAEYQALLKDKTLMRVFDHLLKEKVEIAKKEILATTSSAIASGNMKMVNGNETGRAIMPKNMGNYHLTESGGACKQGNLVHQQVVKSPSDTTLYAPAVKRAINTVDKATTPLKLVNTDRNQVNEDMIKKISDFVDSIRVNERDKQESAGTSRDEVVNTPDVYKEREDYNAAKSKAEQAILDAEKYKAVLADPQVSWSI